jgi:hypothetical protein
MKVEMLFPGLLLALKVLKDQGNQLHTLPKLLQTMLEEKHTNKE